MKRNVAFDPAAAEAKARFDARDVAQLRRQCKRRKLSVDGHKMDLVNRLVDYDLRQQKRSKARTDPSSNESLLPPIGSKSRQSEISGLDLAPLKPLQASADGRRRLPPLTQAPIRSHGAHKQKNAKKPKHLSADEARDETIRDLVSHAFEWPADEVAQQHEDRVFPRTKTGQRMSCWAPEVDVEYMGMLGGVGLRLYFEFLRACALLFACLTVLSAPALYFNFYGSGLMDDHPSALVKTTHGNLFPEIRETPFVDCTEFYDIECCKVATEAAATAAGGAAVLTPSCGGGLQQLYYTMTCTANWTQQVEAPNPSVTADANASSYDYADLCSGFCNSLSASCSYLPMFKRHSSNRGDGDHGRGGAGADRESNATEMWNKAGTAVGTRYSATVLDGHRQCFMAAWDAREWADTFAGWGTLSPGELGRGERPSALYVGWGNESCVGFVTEDPEILHWELQVCALCDGASVIFVLCWYVWLVRRHEWIIKDQDDDMISMSDYTVQVVCRTIPEDLGREELLSWMEERFGTVVLLEMCVDNDEAISLYEAKAALVFTQNCLIAKSKHAGFSCKPVLEPGQEYSGPHSAKLTDLARKIDQIDKQIQEESKRRKTDEQLPDGVHPYKTISAFVTFETDESFELAMKWENIAKYRNKLGSRVIRDGYQVHLEEAPEPDTIIWKHLEYGEVERRKRRFGVNCIVLFILSLSFCAIVIVSAFKSTDGLLDDCATILDEAVSSTHTVVSILNNDSAQVRVASAKGAEVFHPMCALVDMAFANISSQNVSTTPSFDLFAACFGAEQNQTEPVPEYCTDRAKYATMQRYRNDENVHSACYQCLCDSSDSSVNLFENSTGAEAGTYCEEWARHALSSQVAKLVASGLAFVFNQVIKLVMAKIVDWEKPHTLGARQSSLMLKIFLAQLFNTALLVVILNLNAEVLGIVGVVLDEVRPSGVYFDDFTNAWYTNVGAAIISAMVIQNIVPPCSQVAQGVVNNWKIRRKRRSTARHARGEAGSIKACMACACLDGPPAYTEQELRESVNGEDFKLAAFYAEAFLLLFVSLMYGSGMPILYPLAVCGFTLKFFSCKWGVLAVYRDPPMFGPQFGTTTTHLLPCALILHCCVGVWIWGRRVEVNWSQDGGFLLQFAGRALGSWNTVPLAVVAVGTVLAYVIWWVGWIILSKTEMDCEKRYRAWKEQYDERQAQEEGCAHQADAVPDFSTAVRKNLFVDGENTLTSYAIQDNPDYAHAFSHLPQQKDTWQYQRIRTGVYGDALSLRGHASPPVSPRGPLKQTDEENIDCEARATMKWENTVRALLELKRPELDKADARRARDKAAEIARRKWRAAHPPRPRAGQYVMSRRMWLHQLHEDVTLERSHSGAGDARMEPLNVSGLPLSDAWEKHIEGTGALPLRSVGDIYCAGARTERELYEYERVNGAGGGLGTHYFLRRRPQRSPALAQAYPNDPINRAERQRNAALQMINRAEDEYFGGPTTISGSKKSMIRRDFNGAPNSSALREYS